MSVLDSVETVWKTGMISERLYNSHDQALKGAVTMKKNPDVFRVFIKTVEEFI